MYNYGTPSWDTVRVEVPVRRQNKRKVHSPELQAKVGLEGIARREDDQRERSERVHRPVQVEQRKREFQE